MKDNRKLTIEIALDDYEQLKDFLAKSFEAIQNADADCPHINGKDFIDGVFYTTMKNARMTIERIIK